MKVKQPGSAGELLLFVKEKKPSGDVISAEMAKEGRERSV